VELSFKNQRLLRNSKLRSTATCLLKEEKEKLLQNLQQKKRLDAASVSLQLKQLLKRLHVVEKVKQLSVSQLNAKLLSVKQLKKQLDEAKNVSLQKKLELQNQLVDVSVEEEK